MVFQRIGLLAKPGAVIAQAPLLQKVAQFLQEQACQVFCEAEFRAHCPGCHELTPSMYASLDLWVVVGGDGSMLNAARLAVRDGVPVVGINRGNLGFLTDICPSEFQTKLTAILAGAFQPEQRFLLQGTVVKASSGEVISLDALNDIVLYLGASTQLIEFMIEIDGELMCRQRADGLIVTTPTGSTAYSLSAGGPILHPNLSAIALVPMLPHKLTSRPIVIGATSKIAIHLDNLHSEGPRVSFDGQHSVPFGAGDVLNIEQKPERLNLIHPSDYHYFATLRDKLRWESR